MDLNFTLNEIGEAARKFVMATTGKKVIAFHGEMGAGKTTFIHSMCAEMGVKDPVTSPTFSLINQYQSIDGKIIYHLDLYRIKDENEAVNAGIEDCLYSGHICLVEWPEKAPGIFPDDTLQVTIEAMDAETRKLICNL